MKLTDKLYKIGCERYTKKSCIFLDDSHTMLVERAIVSDDKISDYVRRINEAKKYGINISTIIDYRLIPNSSYMDESGNRNHSVGVFLVDRAQGSNMELKYFDLDYISFEDISNEVRKYINCSVAYIEELERRANASQSIFDKLVFDCLELNRFGLEIDPKPSNYYFDDSNGFTITNIRNKSEDRHLRFCKSFVAYIHYIIYGYAKPFINVGSEIYHKLPKEFVDRLVTVYNILDEKIKIALSNNGVDKSIIEVVFRECDKKYCYVDEADFNEIEKDIIELRKENDLKRK